MCICIYTQTYTQTHRHTQTHTDTHTKTHTHTNTHTHKHTHILMNFSLSLLLLGVELTYCVVSSKSEADEIWSKASKAGSALHVTCIINLK